MHTDTRQKGFGIKLLVIAVALIALGALYVRHMKSVTEEETASVTTEDAGSPYSARVSGLELTLSKNGIPVQTLTLGEDATAGMNLIAGSTVDIPAFIVDDIDFDGHPDAAMLTGIGYGGVNAFYEYYRLDPSQGMLVKDPVLSEVGNPVFDKAKRTITAEARDAQDSFRTIYSFKGGAYVKGPTISVLTGKVRTED